MQPEDESAAQQEEAETPSIIIHPPVISKGFADRALQLVLDNIHEGKEGRKLTTHQAAQTFSSLLALISAQNASVSAKSTAEACTSGANLDWPGVAMIQLMSQSVTKKSRYSLLNVLIPYVGASKMITQRPTLVQECLQAMHADTCTVATDFLKDLLAARKSELAQQPSAGASSASQQQHTEQDTSSLEAQKQEWRALWLQPVVQLLYSHDLNFRGKLVNYCLPMLLELDPNSLPDLLKLQMQTLGDHATPKGCLKDSTAETAAVAATIAVLSAARSMHLFDSLDAVVEDEAGHQHVPHSFLAVAAVHKDEPLRIQTLELAALSVKSTSVRF